MATMYLYYSLLQSREAVPRQSVGHTDTNLQSTRASTLPSRIRSKQEAQLITYTNNLSSFTISPYTSVGLHLLLDHSLRKRHILKLLFRLCQHYPDHKQGRKKLTTSAFRFRPATTFPLPASITRFRLPTTLTPACTLTSNLGLGRPPQPLPRGAVGEDGRLRRVLVRSELRPDSRPLAGEEGMWMVLQWPMIRVEASMVIVVVGAGGGVKSGLGTEG